MGELSSEQVAEALGRLNAIAAGISRSTRRDLTGVAAMSRLIVEGAIQMIPGASALLYPFDARAHALDAGSSVRAGEWREPAPADDRESRLLDLGMQAVVRLRPMLSYEEPPQGGEPGRLNSLPWPAACLALAPADEPLGALCVVLREDRRFSALELALLGSLANFAAMALYHAGQYSASRRDLARKEDELRRLRHAGLLITSRPRLEETLEVILAMALEVTGARYGIFRLVDGGAQNLVTRANAGEQLGLPAVEALPINATSIMGWVAKSRQPLNISDVRLKPWSRIYYPLDHSLEMRSELAVPLIGAGGRLEGVLNLESPAVGAFSEQDSHLLQSLATQAVIAIQEVRLLDALQEVAGLLLSQPAQQVLVRLVGLACDLLNTSASAIWILAGEELVLQAASAGHRRGDHLPLRGSLNGEAILTRDYVTSEDVRTDPRFGWPELARQQGWTRALIVPLLVSIESEPLGAFSVYGTESDPGHFAASDWDKKVLTILAHYAALALQNATRQEALKSAQDGRAIAETFAAMGDIAANLLHHLNNKVGTIPVRVEGIQDKCGPALRANPYLAANLAEIKRSALDAMEAVRERLSLLRPIELSPVDVGACISDAIAAANLPPGVRVEVHAVDRLPPVVAGRESLTLVAINLLQNAADAMGGQGTIAIRGTSHDAWVEVAVADSGPGIPPELHGHIFEAGFSGRQTPVAGKLGFGLWWVKTLVTRLGGSISVESDGHGGATFRLRLPSAEQTPWQTPDFAP